MLRIVEWMCCVLFVLSGAVAALAQESPQLPTPEQALTQLKAGNERFYSGAAIHPHADAARIALAGTARQGDYAHAIVLSCSDSRVPVELIFDAGIMDLFVIRVGGNVCDTDELGSIEYGLAHLHTPLFVVLGHTQCGAVSAVVQRMFGNGNAFKRNFTPLVDDVFPAVTRAMKKHPEVQGDALIPYAIEENVWQSIGSLFTRSHTVRNLVNQGRAKVVGAIYDVGTGKVHWLPDARVDEIRAAANERARIEMEQFSAKYMGQEQQ